MNDTVNSMVRTVRITLESYIHAPLRAASPTKYHLGVCYFLLPQHTSAGRSFWTSNTFISAL